VIYNMIRKLNLACFYVKNKTKMKHMREPNIIGVDVGGSKIHIGLYESRHLKLLKERKVLTKARRGLMAVLDDVAELILEFCNSGTAAVGMCVPGYIDSVSTILYRTPNIPSRGPVNLRGYFKKKLKLPMLFDNDAKLFTYAEYELKWKGKISHLVGLTLGTGLGCGIVIDGKLYRGRNGFAGEFGHTAMGLNKELEDFVSGKGRKGELGKYLGIAISDIINIFNPQAIVLGGSVSRDFKSVEKEVWLEIRRRNIPESYKNLPVYVSKLRNGSTIGTVLLARKKFLDRISRM